MASKTPEGKVKDKALELYKKHGDSVEYAPMQTRGYGESGFADHMGTAYSIGFAFEFKAAPGQLCGPKAKKGKVSPHQDKKLKSTWKAGGVAAVIGPDELGKLSELLTALKEGDVTLARVIGYFCCAKWGTDLDAGPPVLDMGAGL